MTNLTERLRYCGKELADHYSHAAIFDEAADEIERLRKRVEFVPKYKARSDALEEAAKVALTMLTVEGAAEKIRALKEKAGD